MSRLSGAFFQNRADLTSPKRTRCGSGKSVENLEPSKFPTKYLPSPLQRTYLESSSLPEADILPKVGDGKSASKPEANFHSDKFGET